jgi:cellulase
MLLYHSALALLALASTASSHATMSGVSVNGKDQGDGVNKYIRSPLVPPPKDAPKASNDPVRDLKSPNLVCNTGGGKAAPNCVKAAAGDTLAFRWALVPGDPRNIVLDPSHKGAILTYIAPYTESNGASAIWSKLAEQGFDGEWATIKMIANGGDVEFTLPKTLAPGKYLIRQELLALHQADFRGDDPKNPGRGAEAYPSCVQFEVTGSGAAVPDQDFDFNQGYTYGDPGLFFNVHIPFDKYTPPGPPIWDATKA